MTTLHKILPASLAAFSIATFAMASQAAHYPDVDARAVAVQEVPAPREGYTWVPGRHESVAGQQVLTPGTWVRDGKSQRWTKFNAAPGSKDKVPELRDSQGNVIPVDPAAYPVGSAR